MEKKFEINWLSVLTTGVIGIGVGVLYAWLIGDEEMLAAIIAFALMGAVAPILYETADTYLFAS